MKQKLNTAKLIYTSLMLFSIFFGAGNMIFPPKLGQQAGSNMLFALLGFIITDAGLAVLGILAVVMAGNHMSDLLGKAGKKSGDILTIMIYFLIGPLFALPRTGSVSFEVGVVPFLSEGMSRFVPMFVYTLCFFGITFLFSLRPMKIIDIVGKVMTPILLLSILLIFIVSCISPVGPIITPEAGYSHGPFVEGLLQGYLALDGFASLVFAIIIIEYLRSEGVKERKSMVRTTALIGVIAVVLLCLTYGALCYIGAQTSSMEPYSNGGLLLNDAVNTLFGPWGNLILGVAMILACLTTSIGLTTSFGDYFSERFPRFSYRQVITVVCLFTWAVSNVGLDMLINTVLPLLVILYPLITVLVVLSFFDRFWKGRTEVYAFSMLFALSFSIFDGLNTAHISLGGLTEQVMKMPLADKGVGWLIPAAIGFVIGVSPIGKSVRKYFAKFKKDAKIN